MHGYIYMQCGMNWRKKTRNSLRPMLSLSARQAECRRKRQAKWSTRWFRIRPPKIQTNSMQLLIWKRSILHLCVLVGSNLASWFEYLKILYKEPNTEVFRSLRCHRGPQPLPPCIYVIQYLIIRKITEYLLVLPNKSHAV